MTMYNYNSSKAHDAELGHEAWPQMAVFANPEVLEVPGSSKKDLQIPPEFKQAAAPVVAQSEEDLALAAVDHAAHLKAS